MQLKRLLFVTYIHATI